MKDFISASQSTRLGARKLYHLAPFLSFISHELSEIGSGAAKHRPAKVGKPRLYLGVGEARVDLVIEPVDDIRSNWDANGTILRICAYQFAIKRVLLCKV